MSVSFAPSCGTKHHGILYIMVLTCCLACSSDSDVYNHSWKWILQEELAQRTGSSILVDSVAMEFQSLHGVTRTAGGEDITLAYRTVRTDLDISEVVLHAAYDTPLSADIDGDGDVDIAGRSSNEIWWLENLSNGRFWREHLIDSELPGYLKYLKIYDIDLDGNIDFLVSLTHECFWESFWFENTNGSLTRHAVEMSTPRYDPTMIVPSGVTGQPAAIEEHNWRTDWRITNNGCLEIIGGRGIPGFVGVDSLFIIRDSDVDIDIRTSDKESVCPLHGRLMQVWFDDLNGDRIDDIVACGDFSDDGRLELRWFEESGDSSWIIHSVMYLPQDPNTTFRTGDVDGDGDLDLVYQVFSYDGTDEIKWLENVSSGQDWRPRRIETPEGTHAMSVGDFDGDSAVEIVCFSGLTEEPEAFLLEPVMYQSRGSITSPVFVSDVPVLLSALDWVSNEPEYTSICFQQRAGNSPETLGKWSDTLWTDGDLEDLMAGPCLCFQYRATLETSDCRYTPVLQDVRIAYEDLEQPYDLPDPFPPKIVQRDSIPTIRANSGSVIGLVLSEDGEPLPGAPVLIRELEKQINTDEMGRFELDLEPGSYTIVTEGIRAEFADSVSVIIESGMRLPVALTPGIRQAPDSSDQVTVTHVPGETGILGRVTDSHGTPLSGATVMIVGTSMGAMTDADGYFEILQTMPGRYTLKASMVGMRSVTAELIEVRRGCTAVVDFTLLPEACCFIAL